MTSYPIQELSNTVLHLSHWELLHVAALRYTTHDEDILFEKNSGIRRSGEEQ